MIKSHNQLKDTKKFFSVKAYNNNETLYSYKYLHNNDQYLLKIIMFGCNIYPIKILI